jgi:hypothetical protein
MPLDYVKMNRMQQDKRVDAESLAAALAQLDVHYLRTPTAVKVSPIDPAALIAALAQNPSPRTHEALIPLFLRHPDFARYVPDLVEELPPKASLLLRHLYTAAVYLQHLWRGKLEMYLGAFPLLPDYFGQPEWGLPAPSEHFGEAGLRALAEQHRAKTGFNWLNNYHTIIAHYLNQLRLKAYD